MRAYMYIDPRSTGDLVPCSLVGSQWDDIPGRSIMLDDDDPDETVRAIALHEGWRVLTTGSVMSSDSEFALTWSLADVSKMHGTTFEAIIRLSTRPLLDEQGGDE